MMQNNPNCCNDNCNQGRDCPVRAGTHKPAEALHQIQEPAAVHDSDCARHNAPAYPAGACDCSIKAATVAVAAPDELVHAAKQALACMTGLQQHLGSDVCRVEANALRAALAATPAAGFDVRKSDNNAAAPVVLPELGAAVKEVMALVDAFGELKESEGISSSAGKGVAQYVLWAADKRKSILAKLSELWATGGQAQTVITWHQGAGLLWDVHAFGKWLLRVVSPLNWDAHGVYQELVRAGYAEHVEVRQIHAEQGAAPQQADARDAEIQQAVLAERERICAAIKAEDDHCVTEGDYMLDSEDCIKVVRGTWVRPVYENAIAAAKGE